MNLSAQLTHFDLQMAVCLVTLDEDERRVSVYASAQAREAGNYPDLAQQRALQLAWRLWQDGLETLPVLVLADTVSAQTMSAPSPVQGRLVDTPELAASLLLPDQQMIATPLDASSPNTEAPVGEPSCPSTDEMASSLPW